VLRQESLEFLEDVIPRTQQLKRIKEQTAATLAKVRQGPSAVSAAAARARADDAAPPLPNGKKQRPIVNGDGGRRSISVNGFSAPGRMLVDEDPDEQLQLEMRRADRGQQADDDVIMVD